MKVSIAGKIGETVISDATRHKFAMVEHLLQQQGHEVFNPTDAMYQQRLRNQYERDRDALDPWLDGDFPDFYSYVLLLDQMILSTKDAVCVLDDWRDSPGARSEVSFARAIGKQVMDIHGNVWNDDQKVSIAV